MNRLITLSFLIATLYGCEQAKPVDAKDVTSNWEAYTDNVVQIEGKHIKRNKNLIYIPMGRLDFFVLEDNSGRIRVWYDRFRNRCPPRIDASLKVEGKVVTNEKDGKHLFLAKSISIEDEPSLADNEVRMCQLSMQEQQIHSREGMDGLKKYWERTGKAERVVVYD